MQFMFTILPRGYFGDFLVLNCDHHSFGADRAIWFEPVSIVYCSQLVSTVNIP